MTQPPSGQPQRNPLRAALERFGRERRGQPQPRLYRTVAEEQEFREAKEKYGLKDHWPQGQPQSSTAASPDEVERRRRADSTAIEQGQPQQEPAPYDWRDADVDRPELQERQAGGHVHERGDTTTYADTTYIECRLCAAQGMLWIRQPRGWNDYEQGVADAAAKVKE